MLLEVFITSFVTIIVRIMLCFGSLQWDGDYRSKF